MKSAFLGFFKYNHDSIADLKNQNKVILFGIPFERIKANKRGSRKAPDALRKKSSEFSGISTTFNIYDSKTNYYDFGNFHPIKEKNEIKKIMNEITKNDTRILVLGGDHSITFDTLSVAPWDEKTALIWFDAHSDLADEYPPKVFQSHGTVFANIKKEHNLSREQMLLVGGHGYTQTVSEFKKIQEDKEINHIPAHDAFLNKEDSLKKISEYASKFERIYVSIDGDAFDQAYVPTLATMEPFGLTPQIIIEMLEILLPKTKYVDIVEFRHTIHNRIALNFGVGLIFKILEIWEK